MKRKVIVLLAAVCMAVVCTGNSCASMENKESQRAVTAVQAQDQKDTAEAFARLRDAVPPPTDLKDSQERRNLVKRLTRFNVADKISYIYLVDFAKVMAFYIVKGKVSSVNSMLTCTQQLVDDPTGPGSQVVASPDLDGSYGSNGDAIFFFTDKDIYVEWNGKYLLTDQYVKLSQPPELIMDVTKTK
jgi:hypothetical protein